MGEHGIGKCLMAYTECRRNPPKWKTRQVPVPWRSTQIPITWRDKMATRRRSSYKPRPTNIQPGFLRQESTSYRDGFTRDGPRSISNSWSTTGKKAHAVDRIYEEAMYPRRSREKEQRSMPGKDRSQSRSGSDDWDMKGLGFPGNDDIYKTIILQGNSQHFGRRSARRGGRCGHGSGRGDGCTGRRNRAGEDNQKKHRGPSSNSRTTIPNLGYPGIDIEDNVYESLDYEGRSTHPGQHPSRGRGKARHRNNDVWRSIYPSDPNNPRKLLDQQASIGEGWQQQSEGGRGPERSSDYPFISNVRG